MPFESDDNGNGPARRGGGPPGGSAFLSSRLRQSAEAREAEEKRKRDEAFVAPEDAFDGLEPDFRFETAAEAARRQPAPANPPAPANNPAEEYNWEPTIGGDWESTVFEEPVGATTAATSPTTTTSSSRNSSFPGGRVKLPLLSGESPDNPDVTFVGTAFVRRPGDETESDGPINTFEEYFTYESLFDQPIAEPLKTDASLAGDDPYFVLGVEPDTPWREIVAAHRALVKTHHPDRLIGASPQQLAHSEEALRLVNRAYGELRRRGRDIEDEA
jgi:hypothetical protein